MNFENLNGQYVWALDIETARNSEAKRYHEKFSETFEAPSNYKDPEKIKAYVLEKQLEAEKKDALSWITGKVISVAMVNVSDSMLPEKERKHKVISFTGIDEKSILESLVKEINDPSNCIYQVVGKNSVLFDYPFIKGRLIVHNISIPQGFKNSYNLLDIDNMICSRSGSSQVASLDKMSFALGLEDKTLKASAVPAMYDEAIAAKVSGDLDKYKEIMIKIKEYNIGDAFNTANIAGRLIQ